MNINDARGRRQEAPHGTVGFSDGKGFYAYDRPDSPNRRVQYYPLSLASAERMRGRIWVRCPVRGSLTWVALDNLSPALWKIHREKITTALKEEKLRYFQYVEDNQTLANAEGELVDTQKMLSQLYEKLEDEDKKEFLKNNPKIQNWRHQSVSDACLSVKRNMDAFIPRAQACVMDAMQFASVRLIKWRRVAHINVLLVIRNRLYSVQFA